MEDDFTQMSNEDTAIESVLGENPRAAELRGLIEALSMRRKAVLREAERSTNASERIRLEARVAETDMQLRALRDEEAITAFVENSVRATLNRQPSADGLFQDEEE